MVPMAARARYFPPSDGLGKGLLARAFLSRVRKSRVRPAVSKLLEA
ncbi:MAG: hypothetical protein MZV70_68800 [Desulfobacterales bacterium]|nr:hypothetical protein [Desulfobacterales bacterium]